MRLLTLLVITFLMWGVLSSSANAGPYIELGAGYNRNLTGCTECWDDAGANAFGGYGRLGYEKHMAGNVTLGAHWIHLSQWFEGPPFSDEDESSVDHIGVYVRWDL